MIFLKILDSQFIFKEIRIHFFLNNFAKSLSSNKKKYFVRKLKKTYTISSLNLCIIMSFFIIIFFSFREFDKNCDKNKTLKIPNKKTKRNNCVNKVNINDIARKEEVNLKKPCKISKNMIVAKKIIAKIFLNYLILCFVKNFLKAKSKIFVFSITI